MAKTLHYNIHWENGKAVSLDPVGDAPELSEYEVTRLLEQAQKQYDREMSKVKIDFSIDTSNAE